MFQQSTSFRAMGTTVRVDTWTASPGANNKIEATFAAVRQLFEEQEQRFSRFRPDSELSRLNEQRALPNPSPDLVGVLRNARSWHIATGGTFNPCVHDALVTAGYDRDFSELAGRGAVQETQPGPVGDFDCVVDLSSGVRLAVPGVRLDLGGIVKGWTADRAAELALRSVDGVLVDAGGDIAVGGEPPQDAGWYIGVDDPWDPNRLAECMAVARGGVATSSTIRRRWGNGTTHHLIDPWTGRSAASGIAAATVAAGTAEAAEVLAKSAVILGETRAARLLDAFGASGLLFRDDRSARRIDSPGGAALEPCVFAIGIAL